MNDVTGIIFGRGDAWNEQRRFAIRNLRDLGVRNRSTMEGLIMDEVKELVNWIKQQYGKPIMLHRRFTLATINALWTLLSGERYEHDDAKLVEILDHSEM